MKTQWFLSTFWSSALGRRLGCGTGARQPQRPTRESLRGSLCGGITARMPQSWSRCKGVTAAWMLKLPRHDSNDIASRESLRGSLCEGIIARVPQSWSHCKGGAATGVPKLDYHCQRMNHSQATAVVIPKPGAHCKEMLMVASVMNPGICERIPKFCLGSRARVILPHLTSEELFYC